MARPIKSGAGYFPLDVNLDDKFKLLEAECGLKGFAILIKLYQKIYSCGYCCSFTQDVGLLFAKENGTDANFVSEVIACSIRRGIFDKALFEKYCILTSSGIQKRYLNIKERAIEIILDKQYLLLSDTNLPKNVTLIRVNAGNNEVNEEKNTQSKSKENKENKKKINGVVNFYEENIGAMTSSVLSDVKYYLDKEFEDKLIITCLKIAVDNNKRNWSYAKGVVNNLLNKGIKTQTQYDKTEVEKKAGKNTNEKMPFVYNYGDTEGSL